MAGDGVALDLALRGLAGALLITFVGWVSDRVRPAWGALLAAIPTTTAVSLYFMGRDQGAAFAAEAATSSLVTQASNLVAVTLFAALAVAAAPRRAWWAMASPAAGYLAVGGAYVAALGGQDPSWAANAALYAALLAACLVVRARLAKADLREHAYGRPAWRASHLHRAVLGGSMVVAALALARVAGPVWGGLFASFPATFLTLLWVAYRRRSLPYFMEQALGILPSTLPLACYVATVHFLFPVWGPGWGTAVGYAVFLVVAAPVTWWSLRTVAAVDPLGDATAGAEQG